MTAGLFTGGKVDGLTGLIPQDRYSITVRRVLGKPWTFTVNARYTGTKAGKLVFLTDHGVKVEAVRTTLIDISDPVEEAA